jgi:hypothetical protein
MGTGTALQAIVGTVLVAMLGFDMLGSALAESCEVQTGRHFSSTEQWPFSACDVTAICPSGPVQGRVPPGGKYDPTCPDEVFRSPLYPSIGMLGPVRRPGLFGRYRFLYYVLCGLLVLPVLSRLNRSEP